MSTNKTPFSGDVSQMINPWMAFFKSIGNQFGLININMGRTSNPELEQKILDEVGSYGRQLGRITDALEVIIRHTKIDHPTPAETTALYLLQQQIESVNTLKHPKDNTQQTAD